MIIPEKYSGLDLISIPPIINNNLVVANKYSYRIYTLPNLKYVLDGLVFDHKIRAIFSQNEYVYVGCQNKLYTVKRHIHNVQQYDDKIEQIIVFHPIKIITTKHKLYINEQSMNFQGIKGILHLPTYLNKILLYTASYIKIINIISRNVISTIFSTQIFNNQEQNIQFIKETQALDIVAIGTHNPTQIILFNIQTLEIINQYELNNQLIKDIQFNKQGKNPLMSVVQGKSLSLYNLNTQELIFQHNSKFAIDWTFFYGDSSLYIGSKEQNCISQFSLEEHQIMSIVRSRQGVMQSINKCQFYNQQGEPQINYIATTKQEILYQSIVNQNLTSIKIGDINNFSFSLLRENDWANILTTKDNHVEFWNIYQKKMNTQLQGIRKDRIYQTIVSKCGNYGLIATLKQIHKFTMQSGSYIQSYNLNSDFTNMYLDPANICLLVAQQNKLENFDFVSGEIQNTLELQYNICQIVGSISSQLVAITLQNNQILLVDYLTMKIIRTFEGHSQKILDMVISLDNQYLISTSLDKNIKIWNLVYGNLVQEIILNKPIISLDISESQLIGVFQNSRQVCVWKCEINNQFQLAKAKIKENIIFASDLQVQPKDQRALLYGSQNKKEKIEEEQDNTKLQIVQPNIEDFIKFTQLEEGKWVPIQHIDQIRERNRVTLADADVKLPFFLDFRNADVEKQNMLNEIKDQVKEKTKILKQKKDQYLAELKSDFEKLVDNVDFNLIKLIKQLSPSSYDYELRSVLLGKPYNINKLFIIFAESFKEVNDIDLKVTYLMRFIEVAREDIDLSNDQELAKIIKKSEEILEQNWDRLEDQKAYIESVIEYSKTKI